MISNKEEQNKKTFSKSVAAKIAALGFVAVLASGCAANTNYVDINQQPQITTHQADPISLDTIRANALAPDYEKSSFLFFSTKKGVYHSAEEVDRMMNLAATTTLNLNLISNENLSDAMNDIQNKNEKFNDVRHLKQSEHGKYEVNKEPEYKTAIGGFIFGTVLGITPELSERERKLVSDNIKKAARYYTSSDYKNAHNRNTKNPASKKVVTEYLNYGKAINKYLNAVAYTVKADNAKDYNAGLGNMMTLYNNVIYTSFTYEIATLREKNPSSKEASDLEKALYNHLTKAGIKATGDMDNLIDHSSFINKNR